MTERSNKKLPFGHDERAEEEVTDAIFTVPNVISFIRLCLVPLFVMLLLQGENTTAAIIFAVAASTDSIDGCIARRTHTISRLGQFLDPLVDRVLIISCVFTLLYIGRLPIWIVAIVLIRDVVLFIGAAYLHKKYNTRVPVIYLGKVCAASFFVGLTGLVFDWPQVAGINLIESSWLPGLGTLACSWGYWFIYLGIIFGIATTFFYIKSGIEAGIAARDSLVGSSNGTNE